MLVRIYLNGIGHINGIQKKNIVLLLIENSVNPKAVLIIIDTLLR